MKRLFDILASCLGLIILSPILLVIAILIKILTPGSVLFSQVRMGRNGKPFMIYKYRTMKINHYGNTISIMGEDRITALGKFLRKHKLDELPELWNVFKGDMSFVGPRPDIPEYYKRLVGEERLILEMRPGITSPASIKYHNEEQLLASILNPQKYNDEVLWPDKVKLNLNYYYNKSFSGDLSIILKTIFNIKKKGN